MSRKRVVRVIGVGAAAALLLLVATTATTSFGARKAAAPPLKNGGTLVVGLNEDPDVLDPTLARTFVGRMVFLHMCEKLYDLNSKLKIVPQLAAALPAVSKDKLTYTIKIRSGIKFNDGTALTAAAVKQSLDRHRTLRGSVRASEISPIDSVEVQGNSVVIHLKQPFAPLTAQLADRAGMIMSPKQLDALGDKFATNPVCVGPFQFKDRTAGDHITLTKSNDYYGKANVHLSQITFRIITDQNAKHAEPPGGRHPGRGPRPVDRRADAAEGQDLRRVLKVPTIGYQGITLNIGNKNGLLKRYSNVGTPIARSQYLRTAFDLALDRDDDQQGRVQRAQPPRLLPDLAGQPVVCDDEGPPVQPARERPAGEEARRRLRDRHPHSRSAHDRAPTRWRRGSAR